MIRLLITAAIVTGAVLVLMAAWAPQNALDYLRTTDWDDYEEVAS